jgi:hypothetical protein
LDTRSPGSISLWPWDNPLGLCSPALSEKSQD